MVVTIFLFPNNYRIYDKTTFDYHQLSYSQEGEDMILARLFGTEKKQGFYVDVGAHHPQRFSNTYYFYLKGWRGINIDPLPGSMKQFQEIRSLDVNIECAINDNGEQLTYYQFNQPAFNTFSKKIADERIDNKQSHIISQNEILCHRLEDVLDKFMPEGQFIDFLTIDVEGFDLNVLRSNNWEKYRPYVILVEDLKSGAIKNSQSSPVVSYMENHGYELYAKSMNTLFFLKNEE
jgi:FkbM family methyltransferase